MVKPYLCYKLFLAESISLGYDNFFSLTIKKGQNVLDAEIDAAKLSFCC